MATKRPKVKDASGIDALLLDVDNLQLTAAPTEDNHGTNKGYVDTQLLTEIGNREDAIDDLQQQITTEVDTRVESDATLHGRIDAEEAARISGDTSLQEQLNSEVQARIDGDEGLQDQLDVLVETLQTVDAHYVRDFGDNMTGNLTFNDTNIILDATTGAGTFIGPLEASNIDGGSY